MVKCAAIDLMRREGRQNHQPDDILDIVVADNISDTYRIIAGRDAIEHLKYHVSQMKEDNQALFEMKFTLGLTDGEIADHLGISKNTAAVRIHRLTQSLRDKMREGGYIDEPSEIY